MKDVLMPNVRAQRTCIHSICDSTFKSYQLSEDWILNYGNAKSKYLKILSKVDFEISWNLIQYLNLSSYLKDLMQKQCVHVKVDL